MAAARKTKKSSIPTPRSRCGISGTLDMVGDPWSLLIIRDMLFQNKHRYQEFLASAEGISTNILADRLKKLVERGFAEKICVDKARGRFEYHPTIKARALAPMLVEMIRWSNRFMDDTIEPPAAFLEKIRSRFAA